MDITRLKTFLMWSTIINAALLILSVIGVMLCADLWGRVHVQLFHLNPANLSIVIYGLLGIYKIFWLVFNMVPYAAIFVVCRKQQTV